MNVEYMEAFGRLTLSAGDDDEKHFISKLLDGLERGVIHIEVDGVRTTRTAVERPDTGGPLKIYKPGAGDDVITEED